MNPFWILVSASVLIAFSVIAVNNFMEGDYGGAVIVFCAAILISLLGLAGGRFFQIQKELEEKLKKLNKTE